MWRTIKRMDVGEQLHVVDTEERNLINAAKAVARALERGLGKDVAARRLKVLLQAAKQLDEHERRRRDAEGT
jgi:hypothetical protein